MKVDSEDVSGHRRYEHYLNSSENKAWKNSACAWVAPMTSVIPMQCSTNWANKPNWKLVILWDIFICSHSLKLDSVILAAVDEITDRESFLVSIDWFNRIYLPPCLRSTHVKLVHQRIHRTYLAVRSVFPMISRLQGTNVRHVHTPAVHRCPFDMRQFCHLGSLHIELCAEHFRYRISVCCIPLVILN